ncbi:MAG TPA: endolytic transglycosylase MltG [Ktedonobacteraceae bacterium]
MTKRPGRGTVIALCLVTLVFLGISYGAWTTITTQFSPPVVTQNTQTSLVIQQGESTQEIAEDLYKRGQIRNALAFRIWARIKGLDTRFQAGAYTLTPGMSVDQIITKLQKGQPDERRLVIIEGMRLEQIGAQTQKLELLNFHQQDFLQYTHHLNLFPDRAKYPLLQHVPTMEGLLFPDTYLIPLSASTTQVIDLMLNRFNQILLQYKLIQLAQQHQLSAYQMIILASIVQREAANAGQMPLIAGIYWKRLYQPSAEVGTLLEADPTVQYARDTDYPPSSANDYWKPLTDVGGKIDPASPWNTYNARHPGWPPTPIASPSLTALKAAASPMPTDCYFFLTKPADGSLVCASTYAKFQRLEHQYLH